MKKITLVLAALLFIGNAQAQWWQGSKKIEGNGKMTTQSRSVSNFDFVDLTGSMDVELVKGSEGKIKVEAEENLMQYIETEVKGDHLTISVKEGYNINPSRNKNIKITVGFESLDGVNLTGSGDIRSADMITSENFEVKITGSGNVQVPVQATNARASITGSGDIALKGSAKDFECKVTGSGDISAFAFKCENVQATIVGSGDVQVYASEELRARIPGSGDIEYQGNPKKEDFKTFGSGSISKK